MGSNKGCAELFLRKYIYCTEEEEVICLYTGSMFLVY